jgi:hypothetical protein
MKAMFVLLCLTGSAFASDDHAYPAMADIRQYRMTNADEIALAKSAAPPSISDHADVLVLGDHGYESAVKGTNGFVCLVGRSWDVSFVNPQFWNPKIRSPQCMNAVSARSVLPRYLTRTEWVLAGVAKVEIERRETAARAAGKLKAPEPQAMCYMMSKGGYLNDRDGHWHPHVMVYAPKGDVASWGANLPSSPVFADDESYADANIFFVVVARWSDGTPGPMMMH